MNRRLLLAGVLSALLTSPALPKDKNRAWQTATVLDSERSSTYVGSTSNTSARSTGSRSASGSTYETAQYAVWQVYTVRTADFIYVAHQRLRWRWSKPASLIVNDPVQVAVEKNTLFIRDLNGKVHKARISKRIRVTEK